MKSTLLFGTVGVLALVTLASAQNQDKGPRKKPAPFLVEMLKKSPDEFLKEFDKNKDGFLDMDELPPFLAKEFKRFDKNGDGLLNLEEIGGMMQATRQFLATQQPGLGGDPDAAVAGILKQFDTDMDGKISKKEATGKLLEDFDKIDKNKDGFLDRPELRAMVQAIAQKKGGFKGPGFGFNQPDFDALDKNADGRLTKDELKGTPWSARFADIDANGDGQIDRREWEAYQRKNASKKD